MLERRFGTRLLRAAIAVAHDQPSSPEPAVADTNHALQRVIDHDNSTTTSEPLGCHR
jgi:hypothetical protein